MGASIGTANSAGVIFVGAACHAVAQGALSMVQGGKFFSGAAAGFLGHIGGAAWGASMKGLGYEQFANSTGGIVTFGAISGGVGAELTGGNFWTGAVTGGIVAGLNTALHNIDPPGKAKGTENKLRAKNILAAESSEQDNNYNFFYKDDLTNRGMRNSANYIDDGGANSNTIVINSHSNGENISAPTNSGFMTPKQLHKYLLKHNDLYQNSYNKGQKITIRIEACSTASTGFAKAFSSFNSNATVIAPTTKIVFFYLGNYLENKGVYQKFNNGN